MSNDALSRARRAGYKPLIGAAALRIKKAYRAVGRGASAATKAVDPRVAALAALPQVQAGMKLLAVAERSPAAGKRIRRISELAQAGNPSAASALKALRAAKLVRTVQKARAQSARAAAPVVRALVPVESTPNPRGVFRSWERGAQ